MAAFAVIAGSASATNYYTAPNATGNGLSYDSPGTVSSMLSKRFAPGDSLFFEGGVYDLNYTLNFSRGGEEGNPVFIGAVEGEKPILDFHRMPYERNKNGINLKANYVHMKGLTIRYAAFKGIQNTGSYNILEGLDVYGCCDTGIQHKTGHSNTIINCDSHENFDYENGDISAADFGGNADGFADKQYSTPGQGNTYINCRAWANADDGWDFFQRVGTTKIINCICYNNGPVITNMTNNPRLATDAAWFSQFEGEGKIITDADGKQVRCTLENYYNAGNGNGFKLGGDNTEHNVTVTRCLAVANIVKGFDQNNNAGDMQLYNCTGYLNKSSDYGFSNSKNGRTIAIKNSISIHNKIAVKGSYDKEKDTWLEGFSVSTEDFASVDTTNLMAARGKNFALPVSDAFHLTATSPLIDAGSILDGVDYLGAAPDLGCYEFDPEATGIDNIKATTVVRSNAIYNLAGQKVGAGYKGIIIKNGKKYIQK